jgi:FkbM family methyltransferase
VIVIDVGCARYGGDYSVERLWEWYKPDRLIGYDPAAEMEDMAEALADMVPPGTVLELHREAAWVYDGTIGYFADGLNSQIGDNPAWPPMPCVDLARVIAELPEPIILKLDAEGAEYELLEHLLATGTINRLQRILVEWHPTGQGKRRRAIEQALRREGVVWEQWRW